MLNHFCIQLLKYIHDIIYLIYKGEMPIIIRGHWVWVITCLLTPEHEFIGLSFSTELLKVVIECGWLLVFWHVSMRSWGCHFPLNYYKRSLSMGDYLSSDMWAWGQRTVIFHWIIIRGHWVWVITCLLTCENEVRGLSLSSELL